MDDKSSDIDRLPFYKDKRFLVPMILAILLTIIAIYISLVTADFGFETYWGLMIFYPVVMLSTLFFGSIPIWLGLLSPLQFPLYALLAWQCWRRNNWRRMLILLIVHLAATAAAIGFIKSAEPLYTKPKDPIILQMKPEKPN